MGWVHQGGVRFVEPNFLKWLTEGGDTQARSVGGATNVPAVNDFMVVPGKRVGNIRLNTSENELIRSFGTQGISQGTIRVPPNKDVSGDRATRTHLRRAASAD